MKVHVNGKEIIVEDDLVKTYVKAAGGFNDKTVALLFSTEGVDVSEMSEKDLEKRLREIMLDEIKTVAELSSEEMIEAAKKFAGYM